MGICDDHGTMMQDHGIMVYVSAFCTKNPGSNPSRTISVFRDEGA